MSIPYFDSAYFARPLSSSERELFERIQLTVRERHGSLSSELYQLQLDPTYPQEQADRIESSLSHAAFALDFLATMVNTEARIRGILGVLTTGDEAECVALERAWSELVALRKPRRDPRGQLIADRPSLHSILEGRSHDTTRLLRFITCSFVIRELCCLYRKSSRPRPVLLAPSKPLLTTLASLC